MDDAWRNVRDGNSGIAPVVDFDASSFPTRIAGVVKDFDADDFLLVVNASNIPGDLAWVREQCRERFGDAVAIEDESAATALLALQGPAAETILGRLTSEDLSVVRPFGFVNAEIEANGWLGLGAEADAKFIEENY